MERFQTLSLLPSALKERLSSLGLHTMTPVQAESIPLILQGRDLIVHSKTGSGKTLAFGIPIVVESDTAGHLPHTLILTPTRELAEQISGVLREIATYKPNLKMVSLYGGTPLRAQATSLSRGAHILIGTPGRILDHLSKGTLDLSTVRRVVLDEADRMLDMGFYEDIMKIIKPIPPKRQTLLFSATFSPKIEALATSLLQSPKMVRVESHHEAHKITAYYYETDEKFRTLKAIIGSYRPRSLLIFANTKQEVATLSERLMREGHSVIALHGDLDQTARYEAVVMFSHGSRRIMVATDVASRGLDIHGVDMVINYDLPFDREVYTHRIGRTGRAEATGIALSLTGSHRNPKTDYIRVCATEGESQALQVERDYTMEATWETLCLSGGKRDKLRKGDILGTLCKEIGIASEKIGQIDLTQTRSYIALHHDVTATVHKALQAGLKIKKRRVKGWAIS